MKVKLKSYHKDAVEPKKAYDKDFCYDLVAVSEEEIAPNVWKYGLGWGMQIERGNMPVVNGVMVLRNTDTKNTGTYHFSSIPTLALSEANLSIDIRPRSSIWKTGMVLSNSVGTVDEGYTNEISAVFYHVMPHMNRYRVGDKVAQMKIGVTFPVEFEEVNELSQTERGMKGYGSSGK